VLDLVIEIQFLCSLTEDGGLFIGGIQKGYFLVNTLN